MKLCRSDNHCTTAPQVVLVVIGVIGSVTKEVDRWIEKLGITYNVGVLQKTALLGTARILRKILEM